MSPLSLPGKRHLQGSLEERCRHMNPVGSVLGLQADDEQTAVSAEIHAIIDRLRKGVRKQYKITVQAFLPVLIRSLNSPKCGTLVK